MSRLELSASEWRRHSDFGLTLTPSGVPVMPVVVVSADGSHGGADRQARRPVPAVVVLVADSGTDIDAALADSADVVLVGRDAAPGTVQCPDPLAAAGRLAAAVEENPCASISLAWLLTATERTGIREALLAESATYSMLLSGAEFRRWRLGSPSPSPSPGGERLRVAREGDVLRITLVRATRGNAMDARLRDELVEALSMALWDDRISVVVDAVGPSSGTGGELTEFGSTPDLPLAHLVRTASSVGGIVHSLRDRIEIRVHGRCYGAGVEVPAFAGTVVARRGTTFTLPEVSMGLIPGAGGTVSVPRRIGRHRAAWWMLSGEEIDADTAMAWGLVDAVG